MNVEAAGSHFCKIEYLIYKMSEVIGGCFDSLYRFDLAWREFPVDPFPQQVDKADDRIQRGAQLMRNIGKKIILHPVGTQQLG